MIKYQTKWHGSSMAQIEAIEVLRETEKQVVLLLGNGKESRENKKSDWQNWFDTWKQAHEFLVSEAVKEVRELRLKLQQANGHLGSIKGMKDTTILKENEHGIQR